MPSYLDGRGFVTPLKEFFADPGMALATVNFKGLPEQLTSSAWRSD